MVDYPAAISLYKHLNTREQILEPNHHDILSHTRRSQPPLLGHANKAIWAPFRSRSSTIRTSEQRPRGHANDEGSYTCRCIRGRGALQAPSLWANEISQKDRDKVETGPQIHPRYNSLADAYKSVGRLANTIKRCTVRATTGASALPWAAHASPRVSRPQQSHTDIRSSRQMSSPSHQHVRATTGNDHIRIYGLT